MAKDALLALKKVPVPSCLSGTQNDDTTTSAS